MYFSQKIKVVRLDIFLVEKGILKTRSLVKKLIKDQKILVNGLPAKKTGQDISDNDNVEILEKFKFVSRAGYKLEKGLEKFEIKVNGLVAVDLGVSTGGFTDCLLQRGVKEVYSIDVGYGKIAKSIRMNERVSCFEKVDVSHLDTLIKTGQFPPFKNEQYAELSFNNVVSADPKEIDISSSGLS